MNTWSYTSSPFQSRVHFAKGRLIKDNALVEMECFHWMKKKVSGKKGVMALKLGMLKAYD